MASDAAVPPGAHERLSEGARGAPAGGEGGREGGGKEGRDASRSHRYGDRGRNSALPNEPRATGVLANARAVACSQMRALTICCVFALTVVFPTLTAAFGGGWHSASDGRTTNGLARFSRDAGQHLTRAVLGHSVWLVESEASLRPLGRLGRYGRVQLTRPRVAHVGNAWPCRFC